MGKRAETGKKDGSARPYARRIPPLAGLLVLCTLLAGVSAASAEDETVTSDPIIRDGEAGGRLAFGSTTITQTGPAGSAGTSSGPVYACYFSHQYTNMRGEARQGANFQPDTTGPELVVGKYYRRQCLHDDGTLALEDGFIYANDPALLLGHTSTTIREFIITQLLAPEALPLSLSPDGKQITGVETWISSEAPTELGPRWASAGGLTIGVQAKLLHVTILPGDESDSFNCTNFPVWQPGATPGCSHTYLEEHASGGYLMTTTTKWELEWQDYDEDVFAPLTVIPIDLVVPVNVVDLEAIISR